MTPSARLALLLAGTASFIIMGAGQAIFGPSLPIYQRVFSLTTAGAGTLISAFWVGCFIAVTAMFYLGDRLSPRAGLAAIALGGAALAWTPVWELKLVAAAIFGLGYGCLTAIFNPRILAAYGDRGPGMLSLVNAAFSVGAIAAPLVFVALGSDPGLVYYILAGLTALTFAAAGPASRARAAGPENRSGFRLDLPIVLFGGVGIGIETSLGGLGPTALIRSGIAEDRAAELLSLFFVAFLCGRVALAFLAHRLPSFAIYIIAAGLTATCAFGCATVSPSLFFPPMGLAVGLFFPGYYVTATARMGSDARVASVTIMGGLLGAILSPLVYANLIPLMGDRGFFWLVAGVTATLTLLALLSWRRMQAVSQPA